LKFILCWSNSSQSCTWKNKYIKKRSKTKVHDYLPESDGVNSRLVYLIDALALCDVTDDDDDDGNVKVVVNMLVSLSTAFGSESDEINRGHLK